MKGALINPPRPGRMIFAAVVAIRLPTSDRPTVAPIRMIKCWASSRSTSTPWICPILTTMPTWSGMTAMISLPGIGRIVSAAAA